MSYRKLGRTSSQRKAMLRDITTDLIINERIVTTEARAKEVRSTVEKMITLGKRGDQLDSRQCYNIKHIISSLICLHTKKQAYLNCSFPLAMTPFIYETKRKFK